MLDIKVNKEASIPAVVSAEGTTVEIANELITVIAAIHAQFREVTPEDAESLRRMLLGALTDPKVGVWDYKIPEVGVMMRCPVAGKKEDK